MQSIKSIANDTSLIGTELYVRGWVRTRRDSKAGISFIHLSDGSCFDPLQLVVPNTLENYQDEILHVTTGCAIEATGELVESQGKGQGVELQVKQLKVIGWVDDPETYPMSPKRHTMEHLREHAHLRPRTNIIGAVTRVRHRIAQAIHQFLDTQGFFWVNTPIVTANDCEGAGDLFRVSTLDLMNIPHNEQGQVDFQQDFFDREAFLTVSGQLNVETYCMAMSKVYTFGPTFRAENSNTSRHLAEFWMIEPEIAFADLQDDASLATELLKYVAQDVLDKLPDDMAFFAKHVDKDCISRLEKLIACPFEYIEYKEAIDILANSGQKFEYPVEWGLDLQTEHEHYLTEKHLNGPAVVINYPKSIKSFYMRLNDDNETVAAMDVLAPGIGEIIGGSQREERLDVLDARMEEMGLAKEQYYWYRDLRRYGTVPHSGFGLGFERLISYITGVKNVRDVIPFPRTPGNVSF